MGYLNFSKLEKVERCEPEDGSLVKKSIDLYTFVLGSMER